MSLSIRAIFIVLIIAPNGIFAVFNRLGMANNGQIVTKDDIVNLVVKKLQEKCVVKLQQLKAYNPEISPIVQDVCGRVRIEAYVRSMMRKTPVY